MFNHCGFATWSTASINLIEKNVHFMNYFVSGIKNSIEFSFVRDYIILSNTKISTCFY